MESDALGLKKGKEINVEMKSLRQTFNEWQKYRSTWAGLPQVRKLSEAMEKKEIELSEMKFALVIQEFVYIKELSDLHNIARDSIFSKNDPLPMYDRRLIVLALKKLKKHSDQILMDLERGWFGPESVCLDPNKIFDSLERNASPCFSLSCVAYMEMLHGFRNYLKRTAVSKDLMHIYSRKLNCEKSLMPLHRLSALKGSLRKIVDEENDVNIKERASHTLDLISGILDRCYEVLTSLEGPHYVADIDNVLDFSLKLSSLLHGDESQKACVPSVEKLIHFIRDSTAKSCTDLIELPSGERRSEDKDVVKETFSDRVPSPVSDNSLLNETWTNSGLYQTNFSNKNKMGRIRNANLDGEEVYQNKRPLVEPCQRTFWADIPAVIDSGILNILDEKEKALQESKFEIIASEVSYLKSLSVAIALFYNSSELMDCLTESDIASLFSNLSEVRNCSEVLLYDLAGHFEDDILLRDISNVMRAQVARNFSPYVSYCSAQSKALSTLLRLLKTNVKFREICRKIESSETVQGCSLQSFLSLPAQRVTRLPLLFQSVLGRLSPGSQEYSNTKLVIAELQNLARVCNESIGSPVKFQNEEKKFKNVQIKKKIGSLKFTGLFSL